MGEPSGERRVREKAGWQRASFLELFFDLVFVFALNQVSLRLIHDFSVGRQLRFGEAVETFLLFMAIWVLWLSTVAITSRQNPDSMVIQIVVVIAIAGAVVMAVAVPQGSSSGLSSSPAPTWLPGRSACCSSRSFTVERSLHLAG
jgi:low temperature requirement protein LtrA